MFDKFKKNRKLYITFVIIGIIVFLLSYTVSVGILNGGKGRFGFLGEARQTNALVDSDALIQKDTDIKFLLNYTNCINKIPVNDSLDQPINVEQDKLLGLSEKEMKEIFSNFGYRVEKFSKEEVILEKDIPGFNYSNDCYFIGVNNENIVIYKKNDNGIVEIAKEHIVNPKGDEGDYLNVKDIENRGNLLKTFYEGKADYQFSDIQEAIEYAQALCST